MNRSLFSVKFKWIEIISKHADLRSLRCILTENEDCKKCEIHLVILNAIWLQVVIFAEDWDWVRWNLSIPLCPYLKDLKCSVTFIKCFKSTVLMRFNASDSRKWVNHQLEIVAMQCANSLTLTQIANWTNQQLHYKYLE